MPTLDRMGLGRLSPRSAKQLGALIAPFAIGLLVVVGSGTARTLSAEKVQAHVLALGAAGLFGFLLACAARPIFVVISGSLFSVAAGLVWGPWLGTALGLLGCALSALTVSLLSRALGTGAVRDLAGPRFPTLADAARQRGFALLFVGALGFLIPGDILVAVGAATGMRLRTVLLAYVLGSGPGTLAMATLGASAHEPSGLVLVLGGVAVVLLTILAGWLARSLFPGRSGALTG